MTVDYTKTVIAPYNIVHNLPLNALCFYREREREQTNITISCNLFIRDLSWDNLRFLSSKNMLHQMHQTNMCSPDNYLKMAHMNWIHCKGGLLPRVITNFLGQQKKPCISGIQWTRTCKVLFMCEKTPTTTPRPWTYIHMHSIEPMELI